MKFELEFSLSWEKWGRRGPKFLTMRHWLNAVEEIGLELFRAREDAYLAQKFATGEKSHNLGNWCRDDLHKEPWEDSADSFDPTERKTTRPGDNPFGGVKSNTTSSTREEKMARAREVLGDKFDPESPWLKSW